VSEKTDPTRPAWTADELSLVVENMLDVVFRFDARFLCSFITPSVERVLGYGVADLVGTDMIRIVHPEDLPRLGEVMGPQRETTRERPGLARGQIELRFRHAITGEYIPGESLFTLLLDGEGRFAGVVVAWRDIRKRKEAQAALAEAEGRYREVIDAAREVIFQTDVDGKWRLLSPSWEVVVGYDVGESIGRSFLDVVHPEDRDAVRTGALALRTGERPSARNIVRILTKAGMTRWVELSASLSHDRAGRVTGAAGTMDDVTSKYVNDSLSETARIMDRAVLEGAGIDVLAQRICDEIVASLRLPRVWVGLKKDDGTVRVVGCAGRLVGTLRDLSIRWDEKEESGPIGRAIRTRTTQVAMVADLEATGAGREAARTGIHRSIVIPLLAAGATLGALCVGTDDVAALDADYVGALESFAGRLSMALQLLQHHALMALQAAAMSSSANALFITDPKGRIEWVNASFEHMSGYSREEAVGGTPGVLRSALQPSETFADMWKAVLGGGTWQGEIVNRRKDGSTFVVSQTVTPLFDERHTLTHLVASHEDITARRAAEDRVSHMAEHDPLTDLPNRALLHKNLEVALAQRREGVALLFLDLDRFKLVNDTLGHAAGDELLRTVAERVRACVRDHDLVARQGGDEFIVLLTNVATQTGAAHTAARVLESLARPITINGHDVHVTASIGIALSPKDATDADLLIKQADAAMYRAKQAGRNGVACYSADLDGSASSGLTIQAGLARALSEGELSLQYQPQVDITSGRIVGLEALLRWTSPELGAVSPAVFIPLAEETGLIVDIDRWVLKTACVQCKAWEDEGLSPPPVAVNVSGVTFRHGDLLANLERVLRDAHLQPQHLELELTEGILMQDAAAVTKTLAAIRATGVRVALDDFGTGYSSLSYLKHFKIDALKVDRTFVTGLPDDADSAAIARLIVSMANLLGMSTIAEGVETPEQARFLESIGCTTAQGFLYSKAIPAEAIAELLRSSPKHRLVLDGGSRITGQPAVI
jgi:diguanylate cyclase (GGDEF)-like protein/PAS domain S-box-containing protein